MEIWLTLFIAIVSLVIGGLLTWTIGVLQDKILQNTLISKLRDAMFDKEHVSVNEEFLMTQLLAGKILQDNFIPHIIFAICPGGAMIAEWLSRRFLGTFDKPVPVQSLYMIQERKKGGIDTIMAKVNDKLATIPSGLSKDSKVLLVNDISRSGHTLEAAYEFLNNYFSNGNIRSATLICHKDASTKPLYYAAMTKKTIRFDWKSYDDKEEWSSKNSEQRSG